MNSATLPIIQWASVTPLLLIFGAAVLSTLVEAFAPRGARRPIQVVLSLLALAGTLVAIVWRWSVASADGAGFQLPLVGVPGDQRGEGISMIEDPVSLIGQGAIVVAAILAFLVMADRSELRDGAFVASAATRPGSEAERESTVAGREHTEIFPLALFSTGGMMVFTSAFDLLTLFIALEVLSLPLYVLSAMARRRRVLSQEAAMKYFLMGAFSSAIFLMGAALLYGATSSIFYPGISLIQHGYPGQTALAVVGVVMVTVGLLFKVGAAPFHSWTPDVYQGAPTPITGFMAAGTKAAAFIALARIFMYVAQPVVGKLNVFMWIIIILTIVVGTVLGMVQTDIKRLLAYSSVAHAGFILIAVNAIRSTTFRLADYQQSVGSILFYLLSYGVAIVGAFGLVTLVRERDAAGNILGEATKLDAWKGLGRRSPLTAATMLLFLLSFAGIPLTGGFIGKFEVFRAGVGAGETVLVVIAVLASAATAFFYFRLVQIMFFAQPEGETVAVVESEGMSTVAVTVAAIITVLLGIIPGPVLDFIQGTFA
ncbi:MAG: NADH-quinone oxidoreductase subunit NuoN [Arcanobacterium sp.]|nr:NADH-quinone oxidoreductase subunit NuoN [Arcanobacterium sp.]